MRRRCPLGHHMAEHLHFTLCDIWPDCAISNCVSLLLRPARPAMQCWCIPFCISSLLSVLLIRIHQIPRMSKTHMIRHSEALASTHHPIAPDPVYPELGPVAAQPAQHLDLGSLLETRFKHLLRNWTFILIHRQVHRFKIRTFLLMGESSATITPLSY